VPANQVTPGPSQGTHQQPLQGGAAVEGLPHVGDAAQAEGVPVGDGGAGHLPP